MTISPEVDKCVNTPGPRVFASIRRLATFLQGGLTYVETCECSYGSCQLSMCIPHGTQGTTCINTRQNGRLRRFGGIVSHHH